MTQQKIEVKLYDLLIKSNEPFVASISGEWGIGKTYFWKNIFLEKYKNELSKKQIAYVSLFGHNSLNDIKTDIVLQISKTTKYISKFKDKIKSIKGAVFKDEDVTLSLDGGSISAVLSLLTQSDFKDVIICFDDFERLSSKIDLKDIMGLISNLKEQKSCQIVLIMNEKELDKLGSIDSKKYSDIYKLYKEKIVDYDFVYSVDIANDFDIIYKDLENKVIITDGGNNRVCIKKDKEEYSIGSFGIGKYKFKEPVYSMEFEDRIFVCDWHNHRILEYKNKEFNNQIGIFGNKDENIFKLILKLIKSFASNGSFIEKHFNIKEIEKFKNPNFKRIANTLRSILFYGLNINIFMTNLTKKTYINKPNGCIVLNNQLIFTQKNNKCISVYDLKKKEIIKEVDNKVEGINFGRLGQISYFDEKIYVCDETNNLLWIFTNDLKLIDKKIVTYYNIFSISLNDKYIATCGETTFSVFNHNFELLFEKEGDGEYHGVALDENILYVCNREKSQIEKYRIGITL